MIKGPAPECEVAERLDSLERRLAATMSAVSRTETRLRALEGAAAEQAEPAGLTAGAGPPAAGVRGKPVALLAVVEPPAVSEPAIAPERPAPAVAGWGDGTSLSDLVGGRGLAWLGGIATLIGIVLLLALAISHGWIGREARVALAWAGSAALMLAGTWLHAHRGRTEAAVAMAGTATAGMFATLVVAADVYHLIPPLLGVAGAMVVGAVATTLAIRWAGIAIAILGLQGALVSPVAVGAPLSDAATVAMLAIAAACATWVVLWRRWPWLAFATVVVCAPQWAWWMHYGQQTPANLAVLVTFGSLGLLGAVFAQARSEKEDNLVRAAVALALLNALLVGVAGRLALGSTGGELWLGGLALAHAGAGLVRPRLIEIHDTLRRLLCAIGLICADVALGLGLHGLALVAAWGASAIGMAWLHRRTEIGAANERWLGIGLGAHVALVLTRALIELPPNQLSSGPQLASVASIAILALTCVACARITRAQRGPSRMALDALGLVAIGYLTAASLDGPALVAAWGLESVALARVAKRAEDPIARFGAYGFLAAAALYTVAADAPPSALVGGADSLSAAAGALGATAAATTVVALLTDRNGRLRRALLGGSALALLYAASVAIITAFQPSPGSESMIVLDLGVRQQGQVLLSALWGVVGVAGLVAGLRRNLVAIRTASLVLLLATAAKVFLYDLSTLTSIYRVVSCLVLGALLLAGAFAYQRLRPPPLPDLRSLHPSQR